MKRWEMFRKTLQDVPGEKAFWFCNGTRAMNLYQLIDTIEHTNDGVFTYHCSDRSKNDFAAWILEVLEDEALFSLVRYESSKRWFVRKVREHLEETERRADMEIQSQ